jgi:hypothetical protein
MAGVTSNAVCDPAPYSEKLTTEQSPMTELINEVPEDYDSPRKTVLERYFPDFLAFFFPDAHAGIDWTHGYSLLDKELQKGVRVPSSVVAGPTR